MADCIIKSGESVDPSDARLSDTACTIESGVIIRPPPDLTLAVEPPPKPAAAVKLPRVITLPILPPEQKVAVPAVQDQKAEPASRAPASVAYTAAPDPGGTLAPVEDQGLINPTTVMVAAGAAVAVAGTAVAGSAMGGLSTIQAKIASIFGSSKGAVVTATVVTAGTIVAVKALEKKMNSLEQDLEKTKKEVGDTASSIDRIDALLDRLES